MPYSTKLYDNLPLNARMADEQGLLRHLCEALQPTYDTILNELDRREFFYNIDNTPSDFLDFMGQFVGLGLVEDNWLGIGLNPEWGAEQKRTVIKRAWRYWQRKGNGFGVREAIALWLEWEEAHDVQKLLIQQPFGKSPVAQPPGWWGWGTSYHDHHLRSWTEIRRFGSGDYAQEYQPNWILVQSDSWQWRWGKAWADRNVLARRVESFDSSGSAMGPRNVWQHFYPTAEQWNRIFPSIHNLNPEILDSRARPSVFGWWDGGITDPLVIRRSPTVPATIKTTVLEPDGYRWGQQYPYRITVQTIETANGVVDASIVGASGEWRLLTADGVVDAVSPTAVNLAQVNTASAMADSRPSIGENIAMVTTATGTLDAVAITKVTARQAIATVEQSIDAVETMGSSLAEIQTASGSVDAVNIVTTRQTIATASGITDATPTEAKIYDQLLIVGE